MKRNAIIAALVLAFSLSLVPPGGADSAGGMYPVIGISGNSGQLLGGWGHDGKWRSPEKGNASTGPATYKAYSLYKPMGTTKGGQSHAEEICENVVSVSPPKSGADSIIGVSAPWEPMPRTPKKLGTNSKVYKEKVAEILAGRGLGGAPVNIASIVRVDLEGDGQDEVIIAATHPKASSMIFDGGPSYYSFVALRKIVGGNVETFVLAGSFGKDGLPFIYDIAAVLDLNGDGAQEIVISWQYYEGAGHAAFQIEGGRVKKVMDGGCGA